MEALVGPRAKLDRAREHVAALKNECDSWDATIDHEAVLDRERGQVILRATAVPELPLRWSTILGDAIHNYRCVLDHLVWQLARVNAAPEEVPPNTVQFPIVSDERDWPAQRFRVAALSERHQRLVEQCQPYHRGVWMGAGPPRQPLEDLRDLSNVDKHRFVMVTSYGADMDIELRAERARGIALGQMHFLVGLPIAVGTELAMVDIVGLPDENDYDLELHYVPSSYFAIADGANMLRVMEKIDEAVSGILDFFSTEAAVLGATHPALQTPEERELAALSSLRARLRIVSSALDQMDVEPGVVAPDPYGRFGTYVDDLLEVWDEALSKDVADDRVSRGIGELRDAKSRLESEGMIRHHAAGIPALERLPAFEALVGELRAAMQRLLEPLEGRLRGAPMDMSSRERRRRSGVPRLTTGVSELDPPLAQTHTPGTSGRREKFGLRAEFLDGMEVHVLSAELLDCVSICHLMGDDVIRDDWWHFRSLVDFVADHWCDRDSGIWEVRDEPRHFTQSKALAWVALDRGLRLARDLGLDADTYSGSERRERCAATCWQTRSSRSMDALAAPTEKTCRTRAC